MRSTDNGTNWSHINSNLSTGFYSVSTINSTTAFIAGEGPTILKTQDAGATWTTVSTTGISGVIAQIQFVNETVAFLRIGNIIYNSVNSGIDWSSIVTNSDGNLSAIYAISETKIFFGTTNGSVYSANQSGGWVTSSFYTFSNSPWTREVKTIVANGSNIVVFSNYEQLIFSTNSGEDWTPVLRASTAINYKGASFIVGDDLVAFTSDERITSSFDGGLNWDTPSAAPLAAISLSNASSNFTGNGIILGSDGIQYNTTNSGSTWSKTSNTSSSSNLFSVCAKNENEIYVGGASGTLLKTTNKGVDWVSIAPSNTSDITDLKLDLSNNLYFTTTYGRVYKSADAGLSWDSTIVTSRSLQEISFGSNDNAVVCGINNGTTRTVFYTSNAGANWTICTTATASTIFYTTFFVPTTQTAYICGSSGRVNKSTDGGQTWVAKTSAGSSTLNSAYFLDELTGIVVGNSGNIWKTLDGGQTWSQKGIGLTSANLQSIRFSDASHGIIVGNLGAILKTTDGGDTWTKSAQITGNALMSATLIDGSTTLVAGNSGTIIKSSNAPLPVELVSFTASVRNNTVNLNWETATEVDNYGFEIERKDNNSNWTRIGFIEGHSTSNSPKYYTFSDNPTGSSKFSYRLKQIDNDGKFEYSHEVEVLIDNLPNGYLLGQNYPNPFNPETSIKFVLKENTKATLKVYNALGELVATLFDGIADAGRFYNIKFNGINLSSGLYIYTLDAGKYRQTRKMILMK
jgi:photosystem II stability/assembly factor-like uncharacterized protein